MIRNWPVNPDHTTHKLMTNQNHPITPPPELMQKWIDLINYYSPFWKQQLIVNAAHWGADQELEACCEWMRDAPFGLSLNTSACQLRAARRPKPPTLKEQALARLAELESDEPGYGAGIADIRRALEALPND